jgi:hypothetical protein
MEVRHYFSGYEQFVIEAENKLDAVEKGKLYVLQDWKYSGGNYDRNSVRCVKKIKG